jgi:hypothetical protein
MKCPLLCVGELTVDEFIHSLVTDCLQEECAWWDVKNTRCAMLGILCGLDDLFNQLDRLNDGIRLVK